jgi:sigma-54 dependent transcriptional regulator, acetoin dehydrogenase operon transcriptional activator AcoR
MLHPTGTRVRLIDSVVRGRSRNEGPSAPEYVKRSWLRCLNEYGLKPDSGADPVVVSRQDLLARKEQNLELVSFADVEMANLYQQLAGSGYSIILTDRDGVLLSYYGDPSFKRAASRTGLVPGAAWSERHGGTNGMGTCLLERAPVIVHREQHFLTRNTGLTCCAAPVFDPRGELVAVLDASGESDRAQQHTLVLVNMSAQMIENRLFLHRFRDAFVVRFHSRPELVGMWSEGIIALDPAGAIVAADRNALFQLGCKSAHDLVNAPLERVFDISLPTLIQRSHKQSFHPLPIYEARHRGRFFAVAYGPESKGGGGVTHVALRGEPSTPTAGRSALDELDFGDPSMARNIEAAKRVLPRDIPILLLGETGTGKELFARALHAASERADKPFVAVNCASMPEAEIQNELFGSRPEGIAAATAEGQPGKIVQADGGMLFLDEIGDLPSALQARLLHVLEEREVIAPGAKAPIKVDIRLVSATHCKLEEKIRRGEFREDLFYRLQGLMLVLPRLADRADKRALIRHIFAQEAAAAPKASLSEDLIDTLCTDQWPGNVRQLRNVLRAMIALRTSDLLELADLPPDYRLRSQPTAPEIDSLNPLGRAEREALLRELDLEHGNISHVARKLGVGRNTLYRKMHRLHIKWPVKKPLH